MFISDNLSSDLCGDLSRLYLSYHSGIYCFLSDRLVYFVVDDCCVCESYEMSEVISIRLFV